MLNQSTGEFILLEDAASEYWAALCRRPSAWSELARLLNLPQEDLIEFASELADAGLIGYVPNSPGLKSQVLNGTVSDAEISADLEREMMDWAEENGFVYAAHWELTYRCNELCVHCYNPGAAHKLNEKPNRDTDELNTHEAKQLLRDLVNLGVFRLTLSGGEPTLRQDFIELLTYARELGFQVVIYTNGLKMSPELIEKIVQLRPSAVEISIYSADRSQHDSVTRTPGSFQKSIRTLSHFRKRGIRTVFKTSLTKSTIQNWQNTKELGQSSAETVILSTVISPGVDGKQAPLDAAAEFNQLVILAATPDSPIFVGDADDNWGRAPLPLPNKKPCGAGHSSIAITPGGTIYPCISFPMPVGHVRENGLRKLMDRLSSNASNDAPTFNAREPADLLRQWRSVRFENMHECGKQEHCHYCGDLCPGDAFVHTGNALRAADFRCKQAHARMTAAIHLKEGYSLDDLHKKFGISSEFGREYAKLASSRVNSAQNSSNTN